MIYFVSCLFFCLVVLAVIAVIYGQTVIASIQFCDSSYFTRLNFCTLVSTSHLVPRNPSHPPVFIAPHNVRYRKMWFLYQNLTIVASFSPIIKSIMNRFRNGFRSRIAFSKLYNIAAQSLSRHKLRCMKLNIETFSGDIRFPCVSSVVFKAITIWISQNGHAHQTEQFDTTHDFLGRKLTNLEICIFRSA